MQELRKAHAFSSDAWGSLLLSYILFLFFSLGERYELMRLETCDTYGVLTTWEQGDGWPTVEEFVQCVKELAIVREYSERLTRMIEACESNEWLRHTRPRSLTPSHEDALATGSDDCSPVPSGLARSRPWSAECLPSSVSVTPSQTN